MKRCRRNWKFVSYCYSVTKEKKTIVFTKLENNNFLHKIITGDENWVHHYDPEQKKSVRGISSSFFTQNPKYKNNLRLKNACWVLFETVKTSIKNIWKKRETTINSQRYVETLQKFKLCINRIRTNDKPLFLQHDNARPLHQCIHISGNQRN